MSYCLNLFAPIVSRRWPSELPWAWARNWHIGFLSARCRLETGRRRGRRAARNIMMNDGGGPAAAPPSLKLELI